MYRPNYSLNDDPELAIELVREFPLGLMIGKSKDEELSLCPLPFVVQREEGKLFLWSHLAKVNPILKTLIPSVQVCFFGPNRYVSASLSADPGSVPTWAYSTVHIFGRMELAAGRDDLRRILTESVIHFEELTGGTWKYDPEDGAHQALEDGIVGLKIEVQKVEAKYKMLQNKKTDDYLNILNHFGESISSQDQEFHRWMLKTRA